MLAHKIFARDGYRCTTPGCRRRRDLQAHHIIFRSHGGSDEPSNQLTSCARHHLRGVHEGRVEVLGEAPGQLQWRLGVVQGGALWNVGPGEVIVQE